LTARPNRKFHRSSPFWMLIYVKVIWSNTTKKMYDCRSATNLLVSTISAAASKLTPGTISSVVPFGTWSLKEVCRRCCEVTQLDLAIKLQQNLKLIPGILWGGILFLTLTMAATLDLNSGVGFLMFLDGAVWPHGFRRWWPVWIGHWVAEWLMMNGVASWNATDRVNASGPSRQTKAKLTEKSREANTDA